MLSIQSTKPQPCTPNLLPARIHHDGPVNDAQRYWTPAKDENGKPHAYFRGRHLHGVALALPANYTGAVLQTTDKLVPAEEKKPVEDGDMDEEDEGTGDEMEVKIVEKVGVFDEVMVWGHGGVVDEKEDAYARGVGEWISFAEAMHVEDDEDEKKKTA